MDQNVIRAGEPRELVAAIPFCLGFLPRDSLVAVSIRGDGRMGLVARVDLRELAAAGSGASLATALARRLCEDGAVHVLLVAYAPSLKAVRSSTEEPGRALAAMRTSLPGDVVTDEWWVGSERYAGVWCTDPSCCASGGRPLTELEGTQVAAHMVLAGAIVQGSRDELAVRARAPGAARRAASSAASEERARRRNAVGAGPGRRTRWEADAVARWEGLCRRADSGEPLGPAVIGRAAVALEDAHTRDVVLARCAVGPALRVAGVDPLGAAEALFGRSSTAPDPVRLRPVRSVLTSVVEHVSLRRTAPALTMLSCLSWWEGDGARAGVLVSQALDQDPGYRLALMVADALDRGIAPGWACRQASAGPPGTGADAA